MPDPLVQGQKLSLDSSSGARILRLPTIPIAPPANDDQSMGAPLLGHQRASRADPRPEPPRDGSAAQRADVDLLSLLAHQMMNPVALIDSSAQKMMRRAQEMTPAEIVERAARIQVAAGRLAHLVHDVMERMKLHNGHAIAQRETCSAARIVQEATWSTLDLQPNRPFDIAIEGDDAFVGDGLLLGQMLTILVCNAAKYSALQEVISIKACLTQSSVTLAVTDRGIGIPAGAIPHLFKPFYRACNAADYPGTGLGLNIAERIARLHGGRIDVLSKQGHGTTFTVTLPQRRSGGRD